MDQKVAKSSISSSEPYRVHLQERFKFQALLKRYLDPDLLITHMEWYYSPQDWRNIVRIKVHSAKYDKIFSVEEPIIPHTGIETTAKAVAHHINKHYVTEVF